MLKKIVLGTLLAGLTAVLALGAINRTADRSRSVADVRGEGQASGEGEGQQMRAGNARNEPLVNSADAGVLDAGNSRQGRGAGGQRGSGSSQTDSYASDLQAQVQDWLVMRGVVVSVAESEMVVETEDGEQVVVEGRPWAFTQEQGFHAVVGDQLVLTGFYEDGELKLGQIENENTAQSIQLRDETGRPGWAGRGRENA